ncbi:MAG TPA: segregation/condensation protein A [Turneriella sp.]|nr:segregation/condensation protein A [Turneriella sp.]HNA80025.1 segregation/condensation protein A [Turneriella sp.]HNE20688.1 segregation/condensation protein A [Turneriella sp.]HNJ64809.1 segregation/condensation protein A [Turneriella sp.]HNL09551.1 segregation/condensation protein A [Turneriella sp.]
MTLETVAGSLAPNRFQVEFHTRAGSEQKGPLAVLWGLIESYEVDVFSVSLSRITADFLHYMSTAQISLDEQADFTQTAARLLFYKSRLLLPNAVIGEETPPDKLPYELVEQLLEYKKMQQAAEEMRRLEERSQLRLTREPQWSAFESDSDYLEVDLLSFLRTFRDFLEREEKSRPMQIQDETISAEEMMEYMMSRLMGDTEASFFRSVTGFSVARIIACFLALLELAKQKMVVLRQDEWLGDIHFAPAPSYDGQTELPFGAT